MTNVVVRAFMISALLQSPQGIGTLDLRWCQLSQEPSGQSTTLDFKLRTKPRNLPAPALSSISYFGTLNIAMRLFPRLMVSRRVPTKTRFFPIVVANLQPLPLSFVHPALPFAL
jgi:hypothetical protein